ncbi:MAG TPA: 3-dehydroquinate synthase [Pyrinomonadaceae bacterium]|nr:3-dehydroquinate synthase [Pyrinomonadaceae bacterium]
MPQVHVRLPARKQNYEIKIGSGILSTLGAEARAALGSDARRVALISNSTVFDLYGKRVLRSLKAENLNTAQWLMPDSERHKSLRSLEQAVRFLSEARLERSDAVIALGGGVVGDLAGFAAAVYLRGIPLIQLPTTLLAQIDSSVGGKTAVNLPTGKNLVGAFHQPSLVLIDTETLQTLSARDKTAGWCEAVKQGTVGSRKLFNQTVGFLSGSVVDLGELIAAQCRFKASIVTRDEREEITRTDRRSRRILNFGHTTAHALEKVTGYRRFRHGEAVGWGMLVAGEMSKSLGMLASGELESLREAVRLCGPLPRANDLAIGDIVRAIDRDKKSMGGAVKWILLERVGKPIIVDGREIDSRVLRVSLRAGLQ